MPSEKKLPQAGQLGAKLPFKQGSQVGPILLAQVMQGSELSSSAAASCNWKQGGGEEVWNESLSEQSSSCSYLLYVYC